MIRETHAYRFVSKVSNPIELSRTLQSFLSKNYSEDDGGKNCTYRIDNLTIVLSLTSGRITLYANKKQDLNNLEKLLPSQLFGEIKDNLNQIRREIREYKPTGTKSGYSEDHIYTTNKIGRNRLPSASVNLQFMQRKNNLDNLDINILRYIYRSSEKSLLLSIHSRFNVSYHKLWRRAEKLYSLRLINKVGNSPALYVPIEEERKQSEIIELICRWEGLMPL